MYSLFALDLGNCESASLLLNDDGLNYAISDPQNMNRISGGLLNNSDTLYEKLDGKKFNNIPWPDQDPEREPVFLNETFSTFKPLMGNLNCNETTIAAQYLCSVPEQKSPGNMILAIILANLVFLEAAWRILQILTAWWMRKHHHAMVSGGCLEAQRAGSDGEGKPIRDGEHASPRYVRLDSGDDQIPGSDSSFLMKRRVGSP
ncbi:hypothetical protein CGCSCA5_v002848 [Colletotrichum siamense]|nr:hypothetical protein CGCSCA5_v002848 [Colletotrichum siamense]